MKSISWLAKYTRCGWLLATLVLFVCLSAYQLGLPGLHYDEAKEAGVNAVELLTGTPITAFRGATFDLFGWQLPLMVQDYIGALNVYLSIPFLTLTGIGVPNLRFLAIFTGIASLLTLERTISSWMAYADANFRLASDNSQAGVCRLQITTAGLLALTLLAASPSFVFWSRQGIFVTNLTQPFCFLCIWQGIRWLHTGRKQFLILSAFAGGMALYAKLLAIWVIGPFALLVIGWWLWQFWKGNASRHQVSAISWRLVVGLCAAFLIPLLPVILFNLQTGGTWQGVYANLGQSYYGVNNLALLQNLSIRWTQLLQSLRGDHFWYLGGIYGNILAPCSVGMAILIGLWRKWQLLLAPLLLCTLFFALSLFTISDLFVTHYALLQPLIIAIAGIAISRIISQNLGWQPVINYAVTALLLLWVALDLNATIRYHTMLSRTGGIADHADTTYHLAYHLRYNGLGAPIVLDWGYDAPIRYLSQGTVRPVEIFGYTSPEQPDAQFRDRLNLFLDNPDNVYLLHAPSHTIFHGRREVFMQLVEERSLQPTLEEQFTQRDGTPLFELWKVTVPQSQ